MNSPSDPEPARAQEWEKARDRTLYWTVSLYADNDSLPDSLKHHLLETEQSTLQEQTWNSLALRNAIEPLFNDVADRERLGKVEDYLLDVGDDERYEEVSITLSDHVRWTTEGTSFELRFATEVRRRLRVRRFWYVHRNGALSYHLSFTLTYEHQVEDFYFISMLQKLSAPKEFQMSPPQRPGDVGLFPMDEIRVLTHEGDEFAYWNFVRERFEADARDLLGKWGGSEPTEPQTSLYETWVTAGKVIEVPGLDAHPTARCLFVFHDKFFFELLQTRSDRVKEEHFDPYPAAIERLIAESKSSHIVLGPEYWRWVKTGDDGNQASPSPEHLERLSYLFLAGFIQNIIDFMNQDASEVLDSTDPIYPTNEIQEKEAFFYRFANPRAITSFVRKSRSLEVGNDWIGTCPYLFLIHVLALHNEFLARDYETKATKIVKAAEHASEGELVAKLAVKFYEFNRTEYIEYKRHRYSNVFRYDTERDTFREVERIRGTDRKSEYIESLVNSLQEQTRDLEGRLMNVETRVMNKLLVVISIFSVLQVFFACIELLAPEYGAKVAHGLVKAGAAVALVVFVWSAYLSAVYLRTTRNSPTWLSRSAKPSANKRH